MTSSTGRSRRPFGPARVATAPAAMSAGTLSAAGEPLHRLPPRVARPWTWVEPMRLAASITPGQTCLSRGCSLSSAPVTAAPIAPAALFLGDRAGLGDLLDVDDQLGIDDVGAHLDQQVGAPGQHPRLARAPPPAGRPPRPTDSGASYRMCGDRPLSMGWCEYVRQSMTTLGPVSIACRSRCHATGARMTAPPARAVSRLR